MKFVCYQTPEASSNGVNDLTLKCNTCKDNYHVNCILPNKPIGWIPDAEFESSWLCPMCTKSGPRDNKDDTPIKGNQRSKDTECQNVTMRSKASTANQKTSATTKKPPNNPQKPAATSDIQKPACNLPKLPGNVHKSPTKSHTITRDDIRRIIREEIGKSFERLETKLSNLSTDISTLKE